MSTAARWSVVVAVVVLGLAAAMWSTLSSQPDPLDDDRPAQAAQGPSSHGSYQPASQETRDAAGLPECPRPAGGEGAGAAAAGTEAADLELVCMADGVSVTLADLQESTADGGEARPLLVNLWAYWCEPCRRELPALQEAQQRLGDRVRIVLVHSDPAEGKGIDMLRELGVTDLTSLEDPAGEVAATVGAPPVLPVSVMIHPDGTVRAVHLEVLDSVAAVEAFVDDFLSRQGLS